MLRGGGLFAAGYDLDLVIEAEESGRKTAPLTKDRKGERAFIFADGEDVTGVATVNVKPGKKVDHGGIKVEMVGQVEPLNDKIAAAWDFFTISKDLSPAGTIGETTNFNWKFGSVDKQNETYCGTNVRLRYFVRLTLMKKGRGASDVKEVDIVVQNVSTPPTINNSLKMEVGIEECMHLEFEYDKSAYHMKDVVVGKVYFLLVRIKIKRMELCVVRREIVNGAKGAQITDNETLSTFEIMDGAPSKEQCIPVRFYMQGCDLTPTYNNVQNKFSVKYFLNLVLLDQEDRRYFKQAEIMTYRK